MVPADKPGSRGKILAAREVGKAAARRVKSTSASGRPGSRGLPEAVEVEQWDEDRS